MEKHIYTKKLTSELVGVNDLSRSPLLIQMGFVKFVLNLSIRILKYYLYILKMQTIREPHEILSEYHEFSYHKIDACMHGLTSLNELK